jgi:hypothetical protein
LKLAVFCCSATLIRCGGEANLKRLTRCPEDHRLHEIQFIDALPLTLAQMQRVQLVQCNSQPLLQTNQLHFMKQPSEHRFGPITRRTTAQNLQIVFCIFFRKPQNSGMTLSPLRTECVEL